MADGLFARLFTFTNRPMPDAPPGGYQTIGLLMRIMGWVSLVYVGLMVLRMLIGMLAVMALGAFVGSWTDDWFWTRWMGEMAGAFAAILIVMMLIAILFILALAAAWLYWLGIAYERWRTQHPSGPGHALALGVVTTIVGGLGMVGKVGQLAVTRGPGPESWEVGFGWPLPSLLLLAFGVVLLVLQNQPAVKAAFPRTAQAQAPVQGGS